MERRATADNVRKGENHKWYVYVLELSDGKTYIGCTSNLSERLNRHQQGFVFSTKHKLPVKLILYVVFFDKYKAFKFEKYLKSGSGRAFSKRHLL